MQLYIDIVLLFGSGVDRDPQYPWVVELLHSGSSADQITRADRLYHEVVEYLENVHGPDDRRGREALERLARSRAEELDPLTTDIEGHLLAFFRRVHPEKHSYSPRDSLESLIREAMSKTAHYTGRPDVRAVGRMAAIMFSFGHDCDVDPLYPWIGRTLERQRSSGSTNAMVVLERQARLWMKAVLEDRRAAQFE